MSKKIVGFVMGLPIEETTERTIQHDPHNGQFTGSGGGHTASKNGLKALHQVLGDEHLHEKHASRIREAIAHAEKAHAAGDHHGVHKALKKALADETLPEKHASRLREAADHLLPHLSKHK